MPRLANDHMEVCLKRGADARKYSISLATHEYSGDLVNQLMKFSAKMEQVYKHLQQLVLQKAHDRDPGKFLKHFKIIEDKMIWYEKAEAWSWKLIHCIVPRKSKKQILHKQQTCVLIRSHWNLLIFGTFQHHWCTCLPTARCRRLQRHCTPEWSRRSRRPRKRRRAMRKRLKRLPDGKLQLPSFGHELTSIHKAST